MNININININNKKIRKANWPGFSKKPLINNIYFYEYRNRYRIILKAKNTSKFLLLLKRLKN